MLLKTTTCLTALFLGMAGHEQHRIKERDFTMEKFAGGKIYIISSPSPGLRYIEETAKGAREGEFLFNNGKIEFVPHTGTFSKQEIARFNTESATYIVKQLGCNLATKPYSASWYELYKTDNGLVRNHQRFSETQCQPGKPRQL